jgi:hypothetical protein
MLLLQRKIQEAEDAKKRLAALKIRAAKRTAASASAGAGKLPSGSLSSLSGSVSRAASTPIAAVTSPGAAGLSEAGISTKVSHPISSELDSGAVPAAGTGKDSAGAGESGTAAGVMLSCKVAFRRTWQVLSSLRVSQN